MNLLVPPVSFPRSGRLDSITERLPYSRVSSREGSPEGTGMIYNGMRPTKEQ